MTQPLRVAVIGAGAMGQHHARAIQRLAPRARVVAIADADAARARALAESVNAGGWYTSLEMLLAAESPDVVHVCTPPAFHADVARAAIAAGANVYVEKPFASSLADARDVLDRAAAAGRLVCAGHQLLVARPTLDAMTRLAAIGDLHHVESYFAFRPTRPMDGRTPRTVVEQLVDILPHPVYLLLHFMAAGGARRSSARCAEPDVRHVMTDERGDVFATVKLGDVVGRLTVTLRGRPADSWVRLVGSRGTLHLDYIRDLMLPTLGIGSAIEKVLDPYQRALRLTWGTTAGLAKRLLDRQLSYPGLTAMFDAFYRAIQDGGPAPTSTDEILQTAALCERIEQSMSKTIAEETAGNDERSETSRPIPSVAVTGGTGLLGRAVVKALIAREVTPLVIARRVPPSSERLLGAWYAQGDVAAAGSVAFPAGIECVIHCAAETVGGWDAHQRNSIGATTALLDAMRRDGVRRLVYVSSLAVVDARAPQPLMESSPLEAEGRHRGAYVWGKLGAEKIAANAGTTHDIAVRIARPGALVAADAFDPPGKLGRTIGGWYVAVGKRSSTIPVCDVDDAGRALAWMAMRFEAAPRVVHLIDASAPTRGALIERVRHARPGVRVFWIPATVLRLLSLAGTVTQKLIHPRRPALSVHSAFAAPRCDTRVVRALHDAIESDSAHVAARPSV